MASRSVAALRGGSALRHLRRRRPPPPPPLLRPGGTSPALSPAAAPPRSGGAGGGVPVVSYSRTFSFSSRPPILLPTNPPPSRRIVVRAAAVSVPARTFARSSAPCDETPEDKARTFLIGIGHDPEISDGVVAALRESGLSGEPLLATVRSMAGRWEVGEDEGLEDLVGSVRQQLAAKEGRARVRFWVVPPNAWRSGEAEEEEGDGGEESSSSSEEETAEEREAMMGRAFPVDALEGTSLTDVAKFGTSPGASTLGEYIECACSGVMACSTCHVVVDQRWFGEGSDKVGEACEAEQDMLDLAYGPRETSRLGCQVVLTRELDGLVVRIPGGANNLMDFVPFEG